MNIDNINRLIQVLKDEQITQMRFEMLKWAHQIDEDQPASACNTAACLAGHVNLHFLRNANVDWSFPESYACAEGAASGWLGLSGNAGERCSPWPDPGQLGAPGKRLHPRGAGNSSMLCPKLIAGRLLSLS